MVRRLAAAVLAFALVAPAEADDTLARGEYLARIMDCGGCHTYGALIGQPDMTRYLAGSDVGFEMPGLGVFYPPNLTSDAATGLGTWSVEAIVAAVRTGVRPDGRELAPVMPWHAYAAATDEDAIALATYLKSLPAYAFMVPGPFGPGETPTAPFLRTIMPQ
jgi:mono/diheme cytochrome c family protein